MDDQPNPYESPRTESRLEEPPELLHPYPGDGWKFVLLGVAILCGLVSFLPWLAAILAFISAPVFVRYFVLKRQAAGGVPPTAGSVVAGMTGAVGLAFGIVAASAGAFLGTCSVIAWPTGIVLSAAFQRGYERGILLAMVCGVLVGGVMFFVVGNWLVKRVWPKRAVRKISDSSPI